MAFPTYSAIFSNAQAPPLHHLPSLQPIAPPFKFDDLDILTEIIKTQPAAVLPRSTVPPQDLKQIINELKIHSWASRTDTPHRATTSGRAPICKRHQKIKKSKKGRGTRSKKSKKRGAPRLLIKFPLKKLPSIYPGSFVH